WGTGLLFVLALVGCWAIGSGAGDDGRRWIATALLAGALVNAGIAVLQSLVDLSTYHLELVDARPPGLLGNSVFLGALAAGAVWLTVLRPLRGWPARVACLVLLAAAVELSGSRV